MRQECRLARPGAHTFLCTFSVPCFPPCSAKTARTVARLAKLLQTTRRVGEVWKSPRRLLFPPPTSPPLSSQPVPRYMVFFPGRTTKVQTLDGGCVLHVSENQAVLKLGAGKGWTAISSAVLNGGVQVLPLGGGHVINSTVPTDYDGYSPEPESLLIGMAEDRGFVPSACIGASLPSTSTLNLTL